VKRGITMVAGDAGQRRVARHRLGVVAGRHGDDPALALARGQQGEAVGGAALLEGAGRLQVVELEEHRRAAFARHGRALDRGRAHHPPGDARGGRADIGEGEGHQARTGIGHPRAPTRTGTALEVDPGDLTARAPPGAGTSTLSPTCLPISALASGEDRLMEPVFMSASYWPTMR
jgi:hypothetical protein